MAGFAALNDLQDGEYSDEQMSEGSFEAQSDTEIKTVKKRRVQDSPEEIERPELPEFAKFDVSDIDKGFKNTEYSAPARRSKTLKQIFLDENRRGVSNVDKPSYNNINAPPSLFPAKKYCDITGLVGKYQDPKTGLRYNNFEIYEYIRMLPSGSEQLYLSLKSVS